MHAYWEFNKSREKLHPFQLHFLVVGTEHAPPSKKILLCVLVLNSPYILLTGHVYTHIYTHTIHTHAVTQHMHAYTHILHMCTHIVHTYTL